MRWGQDRLSPGRALAGTDTARVLLGAHHPLQRYVLSLLLASLQPGLTASLHL